MLRLFLKMGGWFPLIIALPLLVVTLIGQLSHNTAQRFEEEGLSATAEVLSKFYTESTDSDGDTTRTYWFTLSFTTQSKQVIITKRSVNSSEYRSAKMGDELEILYLRSDPEVTEVTHGSHAYGAKVAQIILLVIGVIWLGLLWVTGRWTVEALRARRYGSREEAVVQEIHKTNVRVNNRPRYRLIWTDSNGKEGKSLMRKWADVDQFQRGDRIVIYQGLKRSWWVGDIGDRPT